MRTIYYTRRVDYRRFNREWNELRKKSPTFAELELICRNNADDGMFPVIADCAEENGYPLLAGLWRNGLSFKRKRLKPKRSLKL